MTDYRRVIELILEELTRAGAVAPTRCACHGFTYRLLSRSRARVLDAGATRLGLHATDGGASGLPGLIDHTLLKPDATAAEIEQLCREAAEWKFATVCVNPTWVALAASASARQRRVGLLGGRIPARCHHAGCEAVRGAAGDLRRRRRKSTW